jgi:hypothetical protein
MNDTAYLVYPSWWSEEAKSFIDESFFSPFYIALA